MKRGQAFEVFRLLIAAVVAGSILMILLQIIGGFATPTQDPQKVAAQFVKDVSNYGGVRISDPIIFKKHTLIDLSAVAMEASMPVSCIAGSVANTLSSYFEADSQNNTITFKGSSSFTARVWVRCVPTSTTQITLPDGSTTVSNPTNCTSSIWCVVAVIPK